MSDFGLTLYVTGNGPRSMRAIREVQRMCDERLGDDCRLSVVDLRQRPEVAEREMILATPTLVRHSPGPPRRIVGDFSDPLKVEASLGLPARPASRTRASHS